MIRIRSLREGFRRGGVAHSTTPTDHPDTQFTADELEQLLLEPMLVVEVLADDVDKSEDDDKADDAGKSEDAGKSDDADKADDAGKSEDGDNAESDAKTDKPARKPAK